MAPDPTSDTHLDEMKIHALVSLAELYEWPREKIEGIIRGDQAAIAEARTLKAPLGVFGY